MESSKAESGSASTTASAWRRLITEKKQKVRHIMTQEQHSAQRREDTQAQETTEDLNVAAGQDAGVDDLLDEIDGVLERNAEEFVRGFVQKGGQ